MNGGINIPARVHTSVVDESSSRAQKSLEILPTQVLEQAGVFRRHVQYLLQPEPDRVVGPDLKLILDDIARAHKLDERVKDEILEDEDARNVSAGLLITFHSPSLTEPLPRRCLCSVSKVSPPLKRYTLVTKSFPGALQDLIKIAESTLSTLTERDLLAARYREQQRAKECRNPKDQASGSGTCHDDLPHDSDIS